MKLIVPERCLFCGSKMRGGTHYSAYYECGSHLWIEYEGNTWVAHGHEGHNCLAVEKLGQAQVLHKEEIVQPGAAQEAKARILHPIGDARLQG